MGGMLETCCRAAPERSQANGFLSLKCERYFNCDGLPAVVEYLRCLELLATSLRDDWQTDGSLFKILIVCSIAGTVFEADLFTLYMMLTARKRDGLFWKWTYLSVCFPRVLWECNFSMMLASWIGSLSLLSIVASRWKWSGFHLITWWRGVTSLLMCQSSYEGKWSSPCGTRTLMRYVTCKNLFNAETFHSISGLESKARSWSVPKF
jgi:hypothetical protein